MIEKQERGDYQIFVNSIRGLKCDAPGCDYHDDVPFEHYAAYIDKPCPKCGSNLLTVEDMMKTLRVVAGIQRLNAWLNRWMPHWWLRRRDVRGHPNINLARYSIEIHGRSRPKVTRKERAR